MQEKRAKLNMRPGKVDFTENYKEHRAVMVKNGCEVDRMIEIR